jgi:hypothetical protein
MWFCSESLLSYAQYLALWLNGFQVAVRGAVPAWLAGQAARCRLGPVQPEPFGPGLFAPSSASSLSHASTYIPSFFLALRANGSRREALGT